MKISIKTIKRASPVILFFSLSNSFIVNLFYDAMSYSSLQFPFSKCVITVGASCTADSAECQRQTGHDGHARIRRWHTTNAAMGSALCYQLYGLIHIQKFLTVS